jgi:hypothetical protein
MGRLPFAHLPNAWLLLALVLQVLAYPFLDEYHGGRALIAVFDLAILALALRASRAGGHETWLGWVLVVPAMVLHATDALGAGAPGDQGGHPSNVISGCANVEGRRPRG